MDAAAMQAENSAPVEDALSTLETLRLNAKSAMYSISRALLLDKVYNLLTSASISRTSPVWILGRCYNADGEHPEELEHMVRHFHSILWMTYRSGFAPVGPLTGDAGWGCTLRSAQMLLAQALLRHRLAPDWRWPVQPADAAAAEPPEGLAELLRLFWDVPAASSPFSLHAVCKHGAAAGVFPGRWLGPWAACGAVQAAAACVEHSLGLRTVVVASTGGGAPWLQPERHLGWFGAEDAAAGEGEHEGSGAAANGSKRSLLLLVPLVLGLDKLNPVYLPQLRSALAAPQSVGIVGGRPGSSLYFVGCQGDSVLYLDPHQVQPAACGDADWGSFRCDALRTMALASIDPSLALGFYCATADEYRDLCTRLAELESSSPAAPLVCVRDEPEPGPRESGGDEPAWASDESCSEEELECLEPQQAAVAAAASASTVAATSAAAAASPAAAEGEAEGGSRREGGGQRHVEEAAGAAAGAVSAAPGAEDAGASEAPPLRQASSRSGWELV